MALLGLGCKVEYSNDGSSYTAVPEVNSITVPVLEFASVDTTHLGSTGSQSCIPGGLGKPGKMTIESNMTAASFSALNGMVGASKYWKVTFEEGTTDQTWTFQGFITKCEPKVGGFEEKIALTCEVQMSTAPVLA